MVMNHFTAAFVAGLRVISDSSIVTNIESARFARQRRGLPGWSLQAARCWRCARRSAVTRFELQNVFHRVEGSVI
jgi:hypothetical protein